MKATVATCSLLLFALTQVAWADTFGTGANTFDIEFVTIGNPGNVPDTNGSPNPAGSVAYIFRIGKFEISEQMIDKANALGALGIPKDMRGPDKPATSVSWNRAARFVNWLNTSSGRPLAYKFAFQPEQSGYDSNDNIQLWTPGDPGYSANNLYRNSAAKYFLPSDNEWYKAAYFDPGMNLYHVFATGSDTPPTAVASGTNPGTAVYDGQVSPADVQLAGGVSPFGTMAQNGNVFEWEENDSDNLNDEPSSSRGVRGGTLSTGSFSLASNVRYSEHPFSTSDTKGFRVASSVVPEPTSIILAITALAALPTRHRKSVPHNHV